MVSHRNVYTPPSPAFFFQEVFFYLILLSLLVYSLNAPSKRYHRGVPWIAWNLGLSMYHFWDSMRHVLFDILYHIRTVSFLVLFRTTIQLY